MKLRLLFIFTLLPLFASAQPRFKAALIAGMNASQIDGDNLYGYNKFGVNAGAKAYAMLNDNLSLSFELLYSQKGSRSQTKSGLGYKILLNYAEIPVLLHYHDKERAIFGIGFSYSRFLNYKRFEYGVNTTDPADPPVFDRDISFVADMVFLIKKHIGINARYNYSLLPIAYSSSSKFHNMSVYNNVLSFRLMYIF